MDHNGFSTGIVAAMGAQASCLISVRCGCKCCKIYTLWQTAIMWSYTNKGLNFLFDNIINESRSLMSAGVDELKALAC